MIAYFGRGVLSLNGLLFRKLLCLFLALGCSFFLYSAPPVKYTRILVDYKGLSSDKVRHLAKQHISYGAKMDFKTYKNKVMVYGPYDKLKKFYQAVKEAKDPKLKELRKNRIEVLVFAKDTITRSERSKHYNTKSDNHVDFMIQKKNYRILIHNNQNHDHNKDRKLKLSDEYKIIGYHKIDRHHVIGGEHCVIWSGETSVAKKALRKELKLSKKSKISDLTVDLCLLPYPPQCFEYKVDIFPVVKFKLDGKDREEIIESLKVSSKIPYQKNKLFLKMIKKKDDQYADFFGKNFFFRSEIIPVLDYRIYTRRDMPTP